MSIAKLLSIQETADSVGVKADTVRGWIKGGGLPAVNISAKPGGKRPRMKIHPDALEKFLAARTREPAPTPARKPRRQPAGVREFYPAA